MDGKTLNERMDSIDDLIRQGNLSTATKKLKDLEVKSIPLASLARYGSLCRRIGMYHRGMMAYQPFLQKSGLDALPAKAKAEYAVLLLRRGVFQEAENILESLNAKEIPESQLYLSFCQIAQWNYSKAISQLKNYLKESITPHQRLIGEINLSASLIAAQELDGIEDRLKSGYEMSLQQKNKRIQGNFLELQAQLEIDRNNYQEAQKYLCSASEIFSDSQSYDSLFVKKWTAIVQAMTEKKPDRLFEFRKYAEEQVEYETLRDIDLYILKFKYDLDLHKTLYFGSPSRDFRNKVDQFLGPIADKSPFRWGGSASSKSIDLTQYLNPSAKEGVLSETSRKLLILLLKDLYQPFRLGRVFSEMFPDEKFNPVSTPPRVGMLIGRAQKSLGDVGLPHEIASTDRGYFLRKDLGVGLLIPIDLGQAVEILDSKEAQVLSVIQKSDGVYIKEIVEASGLSAHQVRSAIKSLTERGQITSFGAGNRVQYFSKEKEGMS